MTTERVRRREPANSSGGEREVPMLDEHEWELIKSSLTEAQEAIKAYRETHGTSLREAKDPVYDAISS
jgi:ribosomal protein L7/L12